MHQTSPDPFGSAGAFLLCRAFSDGEGKQGETVPGECMFLFAGLRCHLLLSGSSSRQICHGDPVDRSVGEVCLPDVCYQRRFSAVLSVLLLVQHGPVLCFHCVVFGGRCEHAAGTFRCTIYPDQSGGAADRGGGLPQLLPASGCFLAKQSAHSGLSGVRAVCIGLPAVHRAGRAPVCGKAVGLHHAFAGCGYFVHLPAGVPGRAAV